ncbi:hypothetical protein PGB90_007005 [Kerria lacca]
MHIRGRKFKRTVHISKRVFHRILEMSVWVISAGYNLNSRTNDSSINAPLPIFFDEIKL